MVITDTLALNMLHLLLKNGMFNYLCYHVAAFPCVYFTSRDIALVMLSHCNVDISLQPLCLLIFSMNIFCALRHDAVSLKGGVNINAFC